MSQQNLKEEFKKLIDQNLEEEVYQKFLEQNRCLFPLCFMHHHRIHFNILYRKYPIQENYATDFMYLTKTSGDWRAVLIEIEKPSSKIFKNNSDEFHSDYSKAKDQILNWKSKLSKDSAKETFKENLRPVLGHMISNPIDFRYVLILGRNSDYKGNEKRTNKIKNDLGEDVLFLSYDSILNYSLNGEFAFLARKIKDRTHLVDFEGIPSQLESIVTWISDLNGFFITPEIKEIGLKLVAEGEIPSHGGAFQTIFDENKKEFLEKINSFNLKSI